MSPTDRQSRPTRLVDAHVHLNRYAPDEPEGARAALDRLGREMAAHGVAHAVVLSSYETSPDRPSLETIAEIVAEDPRFTLVEGLRWTQQPATDLFALEGRVKDGLVKGIKLYPGYDGYAIDEPELEAVFRIAERHDVPVMIHTGDTYAKGARLRQAHPLLVDDVAVAHPEVRIVMCHLGNPWFQDAAAVLYKNGNVYADISGLTLGAFGGRYEQHVLDRFRDVLAYLGDDGSRLLYGSDWPLVDMESYLAFFAGLELGAEARENVGWRNAVELFGIELPAEEPFSDR